MTVSILAALELLLGSSKLEGVDVVGMPAASHRTKREAISIRRRYRSQGQMQRMDDGGIIQACNAFRPEDRSALQQGCPLRFALYRAEKVTPPRDFP